MLTCLYFGSPPKDYSPSVYAFLSDHLGSDKRSLEGDLAHFSASIDCHFSDT